MINDKELDAELKKLGKEFREKNKLDDETKKRINLRIEEQLRK